MIINKARFVHYLHEIILIFIFQLQLSDEKVRVSALQRYENEQRKEIERLQDKSNKYEDETIQKQHFIETLSRELQEKVNNNHRSIS